MKSIYTLEFDKILDQLAECAPTEGSRALAIKLQPYTDRERIERAQKRTSDAKKLMGLKGMPSFGMIKDVSEALARAEKGAILTPRELLDIANVLRITRVLLDYLKGDYVFETSLDEIFDRLTPIRTLENAIIRAIPAEDIIADDASPELADIRRKMRTVNNKIKDLLQKYTTGNSKILQENIVTTRNGRYVIPVKQEYRNEVKGLIHDTSSSGATLFIEPMAVVDANNELRTLEVKEKREIERILASLSADAAESSGNIELNYYNLTQLAFYFACADFSYKIDGAEPKISKTRSISLIRARHPLLEKKTVVPVNIHIGNEYKMMVVTGPNTGGKTVALKTIGLFSMMAQAGLHIPADEPSEICIFDNIYADIGDEQSIEQSLSTFSSHMVGIVSILKEATKDSLVLFDELGAGTDPVEGAALAMAILHEILNRGCICAATTHYAELKAFALETDGVRNASCEFNVETLKPTYKLIIGTPGKSNAFAISTKLGLPANIVNRAKEFVSSDNKNFEYVIERLEKTRLEMERERDTVAAERAEYERFKKEAEAELRRKLSEAENEADKAREKARQILAGAKSSAEFVYDQLEELKRERDSAAMAERLAKTRRDVRAHLRSSDSLLDTDDEAMDEDYVLPREVVKGDKVIMRNLNKQGVIADGPDKKGNYTVQIGSVKMRAKADNLKLIEDSDITVTGSDKKAVSQGSYRVKVSRDFRPELDVRGMTGDDAWFMVDKYLDEANVAHIQSVRIIHGKGTGALRNAIWTMLKKDKRVNSYRSGQYGEGDFGVTVIELK